jgi:predicted ATPase/DNA-binding CsgD family transcriptional regulator
LPRSPNPLVGRESDLAAALDLFGRDEVRLLTLTGPGGIGKTRLAIAVAAHLAETGIFSDDIWYSSLTAVSAPELVPGAIAQALSVREAECISTAKAIEGYLRERRGLLVVDNCEHVLPAMTLLADLLASCSELKILATSRERLRLGAERVFLVPPLSVAGSTKRSAGDDQHTGGAIDLFVDRAQAVDRDFTLTNANLPAVAEVVRRLDGLPLAIELAAAWMALLSPAMLLARLDRVLPLLAGGSRDRPNRLRSMHDAIEWSYALLADDEQALFRRLGVFVSGFSLETADALVRAAERTASPAGHGGPDDTPQPWMLHVLAALVEKSLVIRETDRAEKSRYRMLEPIREFALARLAERGELDPMRRAHADVFVEFAERHELGWWMTSGGGKADLLAEQANLRAALEWKLANGSPTDALRLAAAYSRVASHRGQFRDGRALLGRVLERGGRAPVELRARALCAAGTLAMYLGEYGEAGKRLLGALALQRRCGDRIGLAVTLNFLGSLAEFQGDETTALARYEEALTLGRLIGQPQFVGPVLLDLADAAHRRHEYVRALAYLDEALEIVEEMGDPTLIVLVLATKAQALCALGDLTRALTFLRQASALAVEIGHVTGLANALVGFATIASAASQPQKAAMLLGAVAARQAEFGMRRMPNHRQQEWTDAAVRAALGERAYAEAFSVGRSLSLDAALADALALEPAPVDRGRAALGPAAVRAGLTRREVEILRLLVERRTDHEMAAALSISPPTVATHVARIREKLGVHSRREAAKVAVRDGLV